jgi:hypothetical protein
MLVNVVMRLMVAGMVYTRAHYLVLDRLVLVMVLAAATG